MEKVLKAGHQVVFLDEKEINDLKKYFAVLAFGGVRVYPEDLLLPSFYAGFADQIHDFKFRSRDVVVAGYPKSGTTWTQEIVWTMLHNPNLDNPEAKQELMIRSLHLETNTFATIDFVKMDPNFYKTLTNAFPDIPMEDEIDWIKIIESMPDRRVIKTHFPPSLLDSHFLDTAKAVYLIRDPRDACLSFYFHSRHIGIFNYKGNLDEFGEAYISNKLFLGDFANHIRQWLPYKNHKNVYFIFYEDLKLNTMTELKKLSRFLEANLTDQQLENIMHYTSFDQMKKQETVLNKTDDKNTCGYYVDEEAQESGGFFRKGIVGEHKEQFSSQLKQKFETYLKNSCEGLNLPYC